jgi:DNA-binding cell septation regulator SpoVG
LQGKDNLFVAMPSYKTKQVDEQGKPIYQDVCYPVTKEFREKLYAEILATYEREKEKQQEQSQSKAEEKAKDDFVKAPDKELPFR